MKDLEIGEMIRYGNVLLKIEPSENMSCDGCFFKGSGCGVIRVANEIGHCTETHRADKTSVIFREVKL